MKKHFLFISAIILSIIATGCGKKEVVILSQQVEGELKGCFKVLDSVCEVSKDENGNPVIVVNIERTNESVPFTPETVGVFNEDNSKSLVVAGFGFERYDDKGDQTSYIDASDNNYAAAEQLNILKLQPGETAQLTVCFDKEIPYGVVLTSEMKLISTGEITLNGAIGKYGIKNFSIDFNYKKDKISGQYQYLTSPAGAYLYLIGKIISTDNLPGEYISNIYIVEDNGKGMVSGIMKGQLRLTRDSKTSPYYYVLTGNFRNRHYQDFHYDLKSATLNEITYGDLLKHSYAADIDPSFINRELGSYSFGSFAQESGYTSSVSTSLTTDEFIRRYRKFIKTYISALKHASAGDPAAIWECTELAQEYAEFVTELGKYQVKMTPAQINEITKLSEEISAAFK